MIALTAAGDERPLIDAIVVQGSADAGGHGLAKGASLMTLLPEVKDSIAEMKRTGKLLPHDRVIPLLAAGGIMDSRGVAAVLALGADAAVLGDSLGGIGCPRPVQRVTRTHGRWRPNYRSHKNL